MHIKYLGRVSSPFNYLRLGPDFLLLPARGYSSFLTHGFFTLKVKNIESSLFFSNEVTSLFGIQLRVNDSERLELWVDLFTTIEGAS